MQTLLSGLSEEASHAYVGAPLDGAVSMDWQPASRFLSEAVMATDNPARRWVWLYRAPWAWLAEGTSVDAAAALHQWQVQQRAVLQLRRHLRQHLILINVDRVTAPTLATLLGFSCRDEHLEAPSASPLVATLASLFEEMASEFWTLYETLEAVAWLPNGEAEFRSNRVSPPSEGLNELLELIHAGTQLPAARQELRERNDALNCIREEMRSTQAKADGALHAASTELAERDQALQYFRQEMDKAQSAERGYKEKGELLLDQLHQLQEELEKHHLDKISFTQGHITLTQELVQATCDRQQLTNDLDGARADAANAERARGKLAEEEARLLNEITQIRVSSQSVREENNLLVSQLHQVQEELEKSCVQNVSFSRLHAALKQELTQAAADQQQLAKNLDDARATLVQVEQMRVKISEGDAQLRKEAADIRAGSQSVVEENDVLLAQLLQVQEELEHYYLANRDIGVAMGQSERTLHRARNVISRMTTHA